MDYSKYTDHQLLELLYTEEDRLERAVVDEFVIRQDRIVPFLSEIVSDQFNWTREPPDWWAVVHATNILGAIGTESTVIPLLRAVRWADAYDCDWVTETLPCMFRKIGPVAIGPLKAMASDQTSGWFCRTTAIDGLVLIAWHNPDSQKEVSAFIYRIFNNEKEDQETRQSAGNALLDLKCEEYKNSLLVFAKIEENRKKLNHFYSAHFMPQDVEEAFNSHEFSGYERDWLTFYDAQEINERQARWKNEDEETQNKLGRLCTEPKIGRNEPCPCGSGKKYKKCCLGKEID
ncbi:MAG: DUF1186 domain-containing protein [Candidatus Omnitrophica bacterium]|nr:DUF1186 domain-containing protein [Candidatus Omnitrophota bacterium]